MNNPIFNAACHDCGHKWISKAKPENVRCPKCKLNRELSLESEDLHIEIVR